MAWVVFWSLILYALLPLGVGLCRIVGFPSFSLLFYSFHSLAIISYYTTLSFLLWCYLTQSCWASLGLPFILLPITQYGHWSFYYITCGLLCPICFFLGILGPFAFIRLLWSFPWLRIPMSFYLTFLGFSSLITLSLILGAHGFVINSLLSLFALLRACCGPFSLFYITYCPWVCYFFLSGLF